MVADYERQDKEAAQSEIEAQLSDEERLLQEGYQARADEIQRLLGLAQGVGLQDTAAQRQLADDMARAQAQSQSAVAGPMGVESARAQQVAAARAARLDQRERRSSELLGRVESAQALRQAQQLTTSLGADLAQQEFADAEFQSRMTDIINSSAQASADALNDLEMAQMIAQAQKEAAKKESENNWLRTIIGGTFTVAGAAAGTLLPIPGGTVVGAAGGKLAGDLVTGAVT